MKQVKIETSIIVEIPTLPAFLKVVGIKEPISIKELSKFQLEAIANEWKAELIKKAIK